MSKVFDEPDIEEDYRVVDFGPQKFTVPEDWSVEWFGDVFTRRNESINADEGETVRYIGLKHINSGELEIAGYDEDGRERSSSRAFRQGDVLFGKLRPNLKKAAVAPFDGVCSSDIIPIYAKDETLREYLPNLMHSKLVRDRVVSTMEGTNLPRTSWDDLASTLIPIPPENERRRIISVLSTVDEQIRQTDEIIEKTKELRRGLMQDLLHQGIEHDHHQEMRIGPKSSKIPQKWEVVPLEEIAKIESGSTPKRGNEEYWNNGSIPWVKSGEFNDRVIEEAEEKITEKALEETGCEVFPEGTLLIALYGKGTVSKTARLGMDAATNQAIAGLLPRDGAFDPRYLQYYLINSRNTLLNVTVNPSSDTGRTNIYLNALRSFKVAYPPIEEQKQIADRLSAADEKIGQEESYKKKLQELKRGLMQDLLTGKVRVNSDSE